MIKFEVINQCGVRVQLLVNKSKSITFNPGEKKQCYEKEGSDLWTCKPNENVRGYSLGSVDGSTKIISGF